MPTSFKPKQTGKTTQMIASLPSADLIEDRIYIVGITEDYALGIVRNIEKMRGVELASKCVAVACPGSILHLRNVDPFNVYIDHGCLEHGELRDVKYLYSIIDSQNYF